MSLDRLAAMLPPGALSTDAGDLAVRSRDSWALAMLRASRGEPVPPPLAVVFASSTEDVRATLRWANERRTPVVPRGLGSGVCGGAQPPPGALVLDLSRMDRVLEVDRASGTVLVQAGARGDRLEEVLAAEGLSTGHAPQSIAISTVGGWIAASSAGQASAGHGAIEDMVLGLTAVLANGDLLELRAVPRSAAGPDLRRLLIGSEGTLAVVTEATLACARAAPGSAWDCLAFADVGAMFDALRAIAQLRPGATFVRGYDHHDAAVTFGRAGFAGGCLAILGYPQDLPGLEDRREAARRSAVDAGATPADEALGRHWYEHRNDAVELYAQIMGPERAFGAGVIVDTMETASLWRHLPRLHRDATAALLRHAEIAGCHVSHVYPSGSSLYFTFLVRGEDDRRAESAYLAAWEDAAAACFDAGGTLTHHHGVGRLKARFLERELGVTGMAALRSIKRALDPNGILNPGALFP